MDRYAIPQLERSGPNPMQLRSRHKRGGELRFPMATYIYETDSTEEGNLPERFEIQQGMTEKALTRHPDTGQPIHRIITGGFGYRKKNTGESIGSIGDFGPDPGKK